jgi:hypothetical protein
MSGACCALINEEKISLRNQHKEAHPDAITTYTLVWELSSRDGKSAEIRTRWYLLSHTKGSRAEMARLTAPMCGGRTTMN